jgi:hypothetical protein
MKMRDAIRTDKYLGRRAGGLCAVVLGSDDAMVSNGFAPMRRCLHGIWGSSESERSWKEHQVLQE